MQRYWHQNGHHQVSTTLVDNVINNDRNQFVWNLSTLKNCLPASVLPGLWMRWRIWCAWTTSLCTPHKRSPKSFSTKLYSIFLQSVFKLLPFSDWNNGVHFRRQREDRTGSKQFVIFEYIAILKKIIPSKLEVAPHALKMCEWVSGVKWVDSP